MHIMYSLDSISTEHVSIDQVDQERRVRISPAMRPGEPAFGHLTLNQS